MLLEPYDSEINRRVGGGKGGGGTIETDGLSEKNGLSYQSGIIPVTVDV